MWRDFRSQNGTKIENGTNELFFLELDYDGRFLWEVGRNLNFAVQFIKFSIKFSFSQTCKLTMIKKMQKCEYVFRSVSTLNFRKIFFRSSAKNRFLHQQQM